MLYLRSTVDPIALYGRLALLSRQLRLRCNGLPDCPRKHTSALSPHARPRPNSPTRRLAQGRRECDHSGRSCPVSGRAPVPPVAPSWWTARTRSPVAPSTRLCSRASSFRVCQSPRAARGVGPGRHRGCRWCPRRQLSGRMLSCPPVVPARSAMKPTKALPPLLRLQHQRRRELSASRAWRLPEPSDMPRGKARRSQAMPSSSRTCFLEWRSSPSGLSLSPSAFASPGTQNTRTVRAGRNIFLTHGRTADRANRRPHCSQFRLHQQRHDQRRTTSSVC